MAGSDANWVHSTWRIGLGGLVLVAVAHLILAQAVVSPIGSPLAVGLSYGLVLAGGLVLLATALGRRRPASRRRWVAGAAGVLLVLGVFIWTAVGFLDDPGWRGLFYVLRWGVTAAVVVLAVVTYLDQRSDGEQ